MTGLYSGIALSLLAAAGFGLGTVLIRKALEWVSPFVATLISLVIGISVLGFFCILFFGIEIFDQPKSVYFVTCILGLLVTSAAGSFLTAMKLAGAGFASPILGASPIFSIGLALTLRGEQPQLLALTGALVIVFGVVVLVTDKERIQKIERGGLLTFRNLNFSGVTIGIGLAGIASISIAIAGYLASGIVGDSTPGSVVAFYESVFGIVFVCLIIARFWDRQYISRRGFYWMLPAGVVFAIAVASLYTALELAPLSIVAPLAGTEPLATYFFILLILRGQEFITLRATLGALLIVLEVGIIGVTS